MSTTLSPAQQAKARAILGKALADFGPAPQPTTTKAAAPPPQRMIQVRAHSRAAPARRPPKTTTAAPVNTQSVRPAQVSTEKRFAPHYAGEPVAGTVGALKNLTGGWAEPGARAQPGAYLAERPYYTDAFTSRHHAGPSGQESTGWNAAQVARAKQIQAANYGKPGYFVRSLVPGGLDESGETNIGKAALKAANAVSTVLPGGGVGEAAGLLGLGLKGLRGARAAKAVTEAPKAAEAIHVAGATGKATKPVTKAQALVDAGLADNLKDARSQVRDMGENPDAISHHRPLTPAEHVRGALKGAPQVRAGQAAGFSTQRRDRFAKAEEIYRDTSLAPEERQARASAALRGQLERPTYIGFKKIGPDEVTNLKAQIMEHGSLRTGQKTKLVRSLDRAVAGIVPTHGEQKLFEQTFGKAVSGGVTQAAKSGRWKNIATNIVNVPRTLQATADLSAFLRQGAVALGRHPVITSKNFMPMVRAFASEDYTRQIEHGIVNHPDYPLMQVGKLALTGGAEGLPHEEQFTAHMLEALGGRKNPIHWSSRAYSTFLNKTRADIFSHLIGVAKAQGKDVHNEQFLRDLGEAVNVFTGRGGLPGSWERGANLFNGLFFSPRLMTSRLKVLGQPFNPALARRNPFVYKQYVRAAAQSFGGLLTILGLAKANGLDVGTDPRSADFGKIKFGNTRVDLGAGFLQYFHLLGQVVSPHGFLQYKSSTTGRVSKLGGGFGQRSVHDVLMDFMEGKLSPPFAVGADITKQQTNFGPFDPKQEAISRLTPLSWQDMFKLYKEHGALPAAGGGALSIFGGGVQTYDPRPSTGAANAIKGIIANGGTVSDEGRKTIEQMFSVDDERKAAYGSLSKGASDYDRLKADLNLGVKLGKLSQEDADAAAANYANASDTQISHARDSIAEQWFYRNELGALRKAAKPKTETATSGP